MISKLLGPSGKRLRTVLTQGVAQASQQTPKRVLVVEDEFLIRAFVGEALRDAGFDVIEAMNADEAVQILNSGASIDLVFSDVRMPGAIDGLGLLWVVKEAYPILPVVITSEHLESDIAYEKGATEYLPKPYQIDEAIQTIQRALGSEDSL